MFAILVVWLDGTQEYVREGRRTATFASAIDAQYWKDFLLSGIADEIQSASVVRLDNDTQD